MTSDGTFARASLERIAEAAAGITGQSGASALAFGHPTMPGPGL